MYLEIIQIVLPISVKKEQIQVKMKKVKTIMKIKPVK